MHPHDRKVTTVHVFSNNPAESELNALLFPFYDGHFTSLTIEMDLIGSRIIG